MQKLRGILATLLIIAMLSTIVLAQTNKSNNVTTPSINLKDPTPKIDDALEKEIKFSEGTEKAIRFLLGFDEKEKITLNLMTVILTFMVIIFLLLNGVFQLIPFFTKTTKLPAALAVTLLLGITKGIKEASYFYAGIIDLIKFLGDWSAGALLFSLILIIIITIIVMRIEKYFKKKMELERSSIEGMKMGAQLGFLAKMREFFFNTKE